MGDLMAASADSSIQTHIERAIKEAFHPTYLEVINESGNHLVPKGSETHFKLIVVSSQFEKLSRVERHKKIYHLIMSECSPPLHALQILAYSDLEWEKSKKTIPDSPVCHRKK